MGRLFACHGCRAAFHLEHLHDVGARLAGRVRVVRWCWSCIEAARSRDQLHDATEGALAQTDQVLAALATPRPDATSAELRLHRRLGQLMRCPTARADFLRRAAEPNSGGTDR